MLSAPTTPTAARGERGFTLVETLIAMVTGLIITGVLFSVLEFSMNESTRISDVAQATRLGRTTMTHIVDALHSACLASGFTPIQENSTEDKLAFVTGYSEEAEVPSVATLKEGGVRKEEIVWSPTTKTLRDYTKLGTGEESKGGYTFSEAYTPTGGTLIGENISQTVETNSKKEAVTVPIFKYYGYAKKASAGTSEASSTLEESKSLVSVFPAEIKTEAKNAASVLISFNTAPTDKKATLGRSADLSSQVTFAFSAPSSEATITAKPCQ
jgi:type II secretory pathway pseudopilin PulG